MIYHNEGDEPMPTIRSSADLRNSYNDISTICHEYGEPVFITKNGRPLATAELNRNGKAVQFYGDERSVNIRPGKDAEDALNKWIRTFKPRIRKIKEAA